MLHQSVIKKINKIRILKTRNQNLELPEEYLTKARKFHDELKLLIDKADPSKKPEKPKKFLSMTQGNRLCFKLRAQQVIKQPH
jgi:hypothetical protein